MMRHYFSAALVAVLIGNAGPWSSSTYAQTTSDLLAPARRNLAQQNYTAASSAYQQVLKKQGGTAHDYYQAAKAAAQNQELKVALQLLRQAVAKGYYSDENIKTEADFAPLATQRAWNSLLTRARTKQQQHEASFNQSLVKLIKKINYQDQHYRVVAAEAEKKFGVNAPQMAAAMNLQTESDIVLIRQVDSLIARHGYPGKSLVGEYQKNTAFFVIQHSPHEKYLPLLTAAADKGELSWSALALFIDRIKTERGEKQVYGSQLGGVVNGKYTLQPIEDEPNVNARRAKLGMQPLEEYVQLFGLTYQVPTATHNPNLPELYATPKSDATQRQEKSDVELIGGYDALRAKLLYPAAAQQNQVRGNVTVQLLIDKDGVPQNVIVVRGLGYGCDEEAMRVMRAARYVNSAGEDHIIRVNLPFPYDSTK